MKQLQPISIVLALGLALMGTAQGVDSLRIATATSAEHSGLLGVLNPPFEKKYGVRVEVIAVGTGKALRLGENGNVDLILAHAPAAEKEFMAKGFGVKRQAVMHNDFVIVGPGTDPAQLGRAKSAAEALGRIAGRKTPFISRGDDSGTHVREKELWREAGILPKGDWYLESGQGMGAVLRIADDKEAYTLSDRGTFIAYSKQMRLAILYENRFALQNPYHVIAVNPKRHSQVRFKLATRYIDYLTGAEGQKNILNFKHGGQQLFYPGAPPRSLKQ